MIAFLQGLNNNSLMVIIAGVCLCAIVIAWRYTDVTVRVGRLVIRFTRGKQTLRQPPV